MRQPICFQAPAILGGGGSLRFRGAAGRGADGVRKKTHAVTARPSALPTAVRRNVRPRANPAQKRAQPCFVTPPLSSSGDSITSTTKPADSASVTPKRRRGNRSVHGRLAMMILWKLIRGLAAIV